MWFRGSVIGALLTVAVATSALAKDMTPRQVADAYMAAWNAHDPDAAAAFMADDVTYFDASVGVPEKGRDAAGE
jgi:ketosteroid isomerase-like protein